MQGRYAIVIGPDVQHRFALSSSLLAAGLETTIETENLAIYVSGGLAKSHQILGPFHILGPHRHRRSARNDISVKSSKQLLQSVWGAYIAIASGAHEGVSVTRDPSGQIPCYYACIGSTWVFASDANLLRNVPGTSFTIDWDELTNLLYFPGHFSGRTAVTGICELLPGETAIIEANAVSICSAWSPWTFCGPNPCRSELDAVELLRAAFREVHEALADWFKHPIVTVSGGLDSSIVATELHRAAAKAHCVNLFTTSPSGDERCFARIVTKGCDYPLNEVPFAAPSIESYIGSQPHLPRPTQRFMANSSMELFRSESLSGCHDVILTGYGGDSVFCFLNSSLPLLDLLANNPSVRDLRLCLNALEGVTGASYFQILRHAVRNEWRRRRLGRPFSWPKRSLFLRTDPLMLSQPREVHPWLVAPTDACRGKSAHIAAILRAYNHLEQMPRASNIAMLSPLLLPPIVEACLAIPTWLWIYGGIDRSIARSACEVLPRDIAKRSTKGTPCEIHAKFFEHHAPQLIDLLLRGELAAHGILDVDAIKEYAGRPFPRKDSDYLTLLELVDTEIWLQCWSTESFPVKNS